MLRPYPYRSLKLEIMAEHTLYSDITVSIGGIDYLLRAAEPDDAFEMEPAYDQFFAPEDGAKSVRRPDMELTVRFQCPPETDGADTVFDTETNWKLLRLGDTYFMPISSRSLEPCLYKMLVVDAGLQHGDIYVTPDVRIPAGHSGDQEPGAPITNYPFQYPLDEVLTVNALSRGRGVEIHGLGIDMGGAGVLFSGTSGAGKSTLAELWKERPGNTILSDDRLVVRPAPDAHEGGGNPAGGGYILYGTPWHGDAGVSAPGGIPLQRIVFIKQALENRLVELSTIEATTSLLVRCFPTFWDPAGMDFTIDFIGCLCAEVPCYELQFLPEQSALELAIDGL